MVSRSVIREVIQIKILMWDEKSSKTPQNFQYFELNVKLKRFASVCCTILDVKLSLKRKLHCSPELSSWVASARRVTALTTRVGAHLAGELLMQVFAHSPLNMHTIRTVAYTAERAQRRRGSAQKDVFESSRDGTRITNNRHHYKCSRTSWSGKLDHSTMRTFLALLVVGCYVYAQHPQFELPRLPKVRNDISLLRNF